MGARKWILWSAWAVLVIGLSLFLWSSLSARPEQQFLMGPLSSGHHQIGVQCDACHTEPFGGGVVLQEACEQCHAAELKQVHDSHPRSKFTDPRNIDRVAKLDARQCVTCHREHTPEQTHVMGVTMPQDYCVLCHADIAEERTTHQNLGFETCASAGCHNFHDNQALYEDFLIKHAHQPELKPQPRMPARDAAAHAKAGSGEAPLSVAAADAPPEALSQGEYAEHWLASAHARGGVNCGDCHRDPATRQWQAQPDFAVCGSCHSGERDGFQAGKHGMRLAQGLSPMTPAAARLPMHEDAAARSLNCGSCHDAHRQDLQQAAVESCLSCHDDGHSRAFEASAHGALWQQAQQGAIPAAEAVSCATCHLPRVQGDDGELRVQHNQNANLRPNEKMIREVCMTCHGLGFAIDALADRDLIDRNFAGRPGRHVQSIEWALQNEREAEQQKQRAAAND